MSSDIYSVPLAGNAKEHEIKQLKELILNALLGLRFGSVEITVHEGKIVQIERKERKRFS